MIARDAPRLARRVATLDRERAWAWRPGHSIRQGDAALARLQVSTYSLKVSTPRRPTKERQLELVDAALRLIASRGIAALSTRALADAVGLSTGAIFRHFPSLEALLAAVVARVEQVLDATLPEPALPADRRLVAFIEARAAAVGQQRGILRLVLSEQFQLALPSDGSARLAACVGRTRTFVRTCVRDGQAAGLFRADLEAEVLATIVMGTVQALALGGRHASSDGAGGDERGRAVRAGLLTLLAPTGSAQRPPRRPRKAATR